MQRLRAHRLIARLVLAWFALVVAVAAASPMVKPMRMEEICSAMGVRMVMVAADDTGQPPSAHTLDCPLCAHIASPPPAIRAVMPPQQPLALSLRSIPAAEIAWLVAAPLPARGPPTHA